MGREFEIHREVEIDGTPEQVWEALTTGTGGWLWPMEYEPHLGGDAPFGGTVTAWDPPTHLTTRSDAAAGAPSPFGGELEEDWFNQLDNIIDVRNGKTYLRYVHSGIFIGDWDTQYDGANQHTDFYLHTLRQYVKHFGGRAVTYVTLDAPAASMSLDGFEAVRRALGLSEATREGDTMRLDVPGVLPPSAVVDYANAHFLGLRTADAMVRVFGRNAWGAPVGIALHLFAPDADAQRAEQAWNAYLDRVFA